jgi:hypothetical protein
LNDVCPIIESGITIFGDNQQSKSERKDIYSFVLANETRVKGRNVYRSKRVSIFRLGSGPKKYKDGCRRKIPA